MVKTAFIYSDEFLRFDYGATHPLKIIRLKLTYELIKALGLLSLPNAEYREAEMADDDELLLFHSSEYIDILRTLSEGIDVPDASDYGIGRGDNPAFIGLLEWSRLVTGASLRAASLVDSGEVDIAFNISGGLHHARFSRASGFCYVNDPAVAIKWLLKKGRRVAYIDIDAHHGDGVQEAFYDTDSVLTISIHETGMTLFPGTGFVTEIGRGDGLGYSVNIPMPPGSDDELLIFAFHEIVPTIIERFKPDIVVAQLGVDSLRSDPLTHLQYTNNGYCEVVKKIKEIAPRLVALGGGGYDIANVARAWTWVWAILNDVDIKDEIPVEFLNKYAHVAFSDPQLRDERYVEEGFHKERMRDEVRKIQEYIQSDILGKIQSKG